MRIAVQLSLSDRFVLEFHRKYTNKILKTIKFYQDRYDKNFLSNNTTQE